MANLSENTVFKVVSCYRDIFGTQDLVDMEGGNTWALLKRKLKRNKTPGVRFHEIIAVTDTGKGKAAQKPRMIFYLAQRKRGRQRQIYQGHNKCTIV